MLIRVYSVAMQVYVWISDAERLPKDRVTYDTQSSDNLSWRFNANTVDRSHEVCSQTDDADHCNQTQPSDAEKSLTERKSTVAWDRHVE